MPSVRSRRGASGAPRPPRYKIKAKRVRHPQRDRVIADWEGKGWELNSEQPGKRRDDLTFRKQKRSRWFAVVGTIVALAVVAGLVLAYTQSPVFHSEQWKDRRDASAAVKALTKGDLAALDNRLAKHRGQPDFAYAFTSQTTPRSLGDALASVARSDGNAPLKAGVNANAYDLDLTDLAGTIALATHGTGNLALPASWTTDFVEATTDPNALYPQDEEPSGTSGKQRADQDAANKQNLLLLLSRGYWSANFLEAATRGYWDYDHANGDNGWAGTMLADAKYAPAPNVIAAASTHLTDGIVALAAALTANPAASDWAFTDFQPGTEAIDGTDETVGKFTHYLFFEHHYPTTSDGDDVGTTATLTALSSAIDATGSATEAVAPSNNSSDPIADSLVLQKLARDSQDGKGCSWNPLHDGHCIVALAKDLLHLVQHWGHAALNILSFATFAPPPFDAIGVGAAATNATWYAVDGDYTNAGLSLAAAVPGLAFTKIAKAAKVGIDAEKGAAGAADAEKAAKSSDEIAKVANEARTAAQAEDSTAVVTKETLSTRPALSTTTKAKIRAAAPKTSDGDFIDPNTGKVIPREDPFHYGHKPGYEWRCAKEKALTLGWTVQQLTTYFNDPTHFQIEDPATNLSHQYESDTCAA